MKIKIEHSELKFSIEVDEDADLEVVLIEFLNLLKAVQYPVNSIEDIQYLIEDYFIEKRKKQ